MVLRDFGSFEVVYDLKLNWEGSKVSNMLDVIGAISQENMVTVNYLHFFPMPPCPFTSGSPIYHAV